MTLSGVNNSLTHKIHSEKYLNEYGYHIASLLHNTTFQPSVLVSPPFVITKCSKETHGLEMYQEDPIIFEKQHFIPHIKVVYSILGFMAAMLLYLAGVETEKCDFDKFINTA